MRLPASPQGQKLSRVNNASYASLQHMAGADVELNMEAVKLEPKPKDDRPEGRWRAGRGPGGGGG